METRCKPVVIEPLVRETKWRGCPQGTAGRDADIYGIVIHTLHSSHINALRDSMLNAISPTTISSGISSLHYLVSPHIEQYVHPMDTAWVDGYRCDFDIKPDDPPINSGYDNWINGYAGWPGLPIGEHIAENCIHIGVNADLSVASYYDAIVRLVRHLSDEYGIPLDVFHVGHYREVARDNNTPIVELPDLIVDALAHCERCCESFGEITPDTDMMVVKGIDVYGCEAVMSVPNRITLPSSQCISVADDGITLNIDPSECNPVSCGPDGLTSVYPSFSAFTLEFWSQWVQNNEFSLSGGLDADSQGAWTAEPLVGSGKVVSNFETITNTSCHDGFLDIQLYQDNQVQISGDGHLAHRFSFTIDGGATWIPYSITHLYAYRNTYGGGLYMDKAFASNRDVKRWFQNIASGQTLTLGSKVEIGASDSMPADTVTVYRTAGFHRVTATLHHHPP